MAVDLTDLVAEVNDENTVDASVVTLLTGLSAQIAALKTAGTDPATATAIAALVTQMKAQKQTIVDAVTANTPDA